VKKEKASSTIKEKRKGKGAGPSRGKKTSAQVAGNEPEKGLPEKRPGIHQIDFLGGTWQKPSERRGNDPRWEKKLAALCDSYISLSTKKKRYISHLLRKKGGFVFSRRRRPTSSSWFRKNLTILERKRGISRRRRERKDEVFPPDY